MLTTDEVDIQNTKRMFAGVLLSAFGVEQTMLDTDSSMENRANQFEVFETTNGRTSVIGRTSRGTANTAPMQLTPFALLVIGVGIYLVAKNV
jgi:hypothetical protein